MRRRQGADGQGHWWHDAANSALALIALGCVIGVGVGSKRGGWDGGVVVRGGVGDG